MTRAPRAGTGCVDSRSLAGQRSQRSCPTAAIRISERDRPEGQPRAVPWQPSSRRTEKSILASRVAQACGHANAAMRSVLKVSRKRTVAASPAAHANIFSSSSDSEIWSGILHLRDRHLINESLCINRGARATERASDGPRPAAPADVQLRLLAFAGTVDGRLEVQSQVQLCCSSAGPRRSQKSYVLVCHFLTQAGVSPLCGYLPHFFLSVVDRLLGPVSPERHGGRPEGQDQVHLRH